MWKSIVLSLLLSAAGFAGSAPQPTNLKDIAKKYSTDNQGALKCLPRILYQGDTLAISMPEDHPRGLAIKTPSNKWYYLQDEEAPSHSMMNQDDFMKTAHFNIPTSKINNQHIFTETGEYLIYMANNLDTEPANTFFFMNTVYYYSKPRP